MPNPPEEKSGIIGSGNPGSSIVSVHTERKVRIFAVHEPELDTLSYLNTATTGLCSLGMLFVSNFFDNLQKPDGGSWFSDPFGWAALALFLAAAIAIYTKKGIMGKIKQESKNR